MEFRLQKSKKSQNCFYLNNKPRKCFEIQGKGREVKVLFDDERFISIN
jgi:hypothetical protein